MNWFIQIVILTFLNLDDAGVSVIYETGSRA